MTDERTRHGADGPGGRRSPDSGRGVGRRALIGAAGLAALGYAASVVAPEVRERVEEYEPDVPGPRPTPEPVARDELDRFTTLAGARLTYEVDEAPTVLFMESGFAQRLDRSLRSHWVAAGWGAPASVSSYGTWVAPRGRARPSWHHEGRAFDVGRVLGGGGSTLISCRYDLWRSQSGAARAAAERAYWRLAATLHRDFAYVLTYLYDDAHANHIHVDDGLSGDGPSRFRAGSRVQVQAVQAMCTHVWDLPVQTSGSWDAATRQATATVLERIGAGRRLTGGQDDWHAFLTATARHT